MLVAEREQPPTLLWQCMTGRGDKLIDMQSNKAIDQEVQRKANIKASAQKLNLLDTVLTSVNGRDAPVDQIVEAANAAFTRIDRHRKLFRDDWLPFLDGVYHLSLQA